METTEAPRQPRPSSVQYLGARTQFTQDAVPAIKEPPKIVLQTIAEPPNETIPTLRAGVLSPSLTSPVLLADKRQVLPTSASNTSLATTASGGGSQLFHNYYNKRPDFPIILRGSEASLNLPEAKGHKFSINSFQTPLKCCICTGVMEGVIRQGYSCTRCKYTCHVTCVPNIPKAHLPCPLMPSVFEQPNTNVDVTTVLDAHLYSNHFCDLVFHRDLGRHSKGWSLYPSRRESKKAGIVLGWSCQTGKSACIY